MGPNLFAGCGWIELDPTNGIFGNRDLIRIAVARDHRQALPLSGSFIGKRWIGVPGHGRDDHSAPNHRGRDVASVVDQAIFSATVVYALCK